MAQRRHSTKLSRSHHFADAFARYRVLRVDQGPKLLPCPSSPAQSAPWIWPLGHSLNRDQRTACHSTSHELRLSRRDAQVETNLSQLSATPSRFEQNGNAGAKRQWEDEERKPYGGIRQHLDWNKSKLSSSRQAVLVYLTSWRTNIRAIPTFVLEVIMSPYQPSSSASTHLERSICRDSALSTPMQSSSLVCGQQPRARELYYRFMYIHLDIYMNVSNTLLFLCATQIMGSSLTAKLRLWV